MANRTKFTNSAREKFLEALTRNVNITVAARSAGVSRQTVYDHKAADPEFAKAWENAYEEGLDLFEHEMARRAFKGTERPVYYQGEQIGTITEYSDSNAQFILRGRRREVYGDRQNIEHSGEVKFIPSFKPRNERSD